MEANVNKIIKSVRNILARTSCLGMIDIAIDLITIKQLTITGICNTV